MADIKFEDLRGTITNAAENVSKRTESFIETQKVRAQINSANRSVEKSYKDLGEMIYQRYASGEGVDAETAVICEDIARTYALIAEKKEELAGKHGKKICPVCEAEVDTEAAYCMKCGSKIEEESQEKVDIIIESEEAEEIEAPKENEE